MAEVSYCLFLVNCITCFSDLASSSVRTPNEFIISVCVCVPNKYTIFRFLRNPSNHLPMMHSVIRHMFLDDPIGCIQLFNCLMRKGGSLTFTSEIKCAERITCKIMFNVNVSYKFELKTEVCNRNTVLSS